MKMLYLSCHSILEYDEVSLFTELGIDVFSYGAYLNPGKPGDEKRPAIKGCKYNDHLIQVAMQYGKENLHPELIEPFDVIMVMHKPEWVTNNWGKLRHKCVIWRSIGQSTIDVESRLQPCRAQGLKIVRYSPMEMTIPGYLGHEAIIRFYKDPEEYGEWNGKDKKVITIGQSMKKRNPFCHFDVFDTATQGYKRVLYGPDNDDAGDINGGVLSYEDLKKELRNSRVYFYTGTQPACYTLNFIEALMTGIPIVAQGPATGNMSSIAQYTYEIPILIQDGINGFWSDDIGHLNNAIKRLMEDEKFARVIGNRGREKAIELFGKNIIKRQWRTFFDKLSGE
jgi:glycosyltransferase involved in cell wall biosynthesis